MRMRRAHDGRMKLVGQFEIVEKAAVPRQHTFGAGILLPAADMPASNWSLVGRLVPTVAVARVIGWVRLPFKISP